MVFETKSSSSSLASGTGGYRWEMATGGGGRTRRSRDGSGDNSSEDTPPPPEMNGTVPSGTANHSYKLDDFEIHNTLGKLVVIV